MIKIAQDELLDQANTYIKTIDDLSRCDIHTSTAAMYELDYKRVEEHDKFTELCRKHGIQLQDRHEYHCYAFQLTGRKMFGRRHLWTGSD